MSKARTTSSSEPAPWSLGDREEASSRSVSIRWKLQPQGLDSTRLVFGKAGAVHTHQAVPVPEGVSFVVCNTNAPRSLNTSEYGTRREKCEQGVRLLGEHLPSIDSLRDVGPQDLERWAEVLTEVVRRRCRFIVEENARVPALADAFRVRERGAIRRLFGDSFAGARDHYEITIPEMEAMVSSMALLGLLKANAGTASLFGGDPWRDAVALHRRLSYVPGDVELWPKLTGGK